MKRIKPFLKQLCRFLSSQCYNLLIALGFGLSLIVPVQCDVRASKPVGQADSVLRLPSIPTTLGSPAEKAEYLVSHYWSNFDYADSLLIDNPEYTEQAFVNFIDLFPHTTPGVVRRSIGTTLDDALAASGRMFDHFAELYEKYLDDPNSPFRNEDYYIMVLQHIISMDGVDTLAKVRPRYQLEMAIKNRPGSVAADFRFTGRNGRQREMHGISSDYLILFFNNPDCHDCLRVKQILSESPVVQAMMTSGHTPALKILAVYPDEDLELWRATEYPANWMNGYSNEILPTQCYDLRAMPTLYLLDKDKRVLLKDAPAEVIIEFLAGR